MCTYNEDNANFLDVVRRERTIVTIDEKTVLLNTKCKLSLWPHATTEKVNHKSKFYKWAWQEIATIKNKKMFKL